MSLNSGNVYEIQTYLSMFTKSHIMELRALRIEPEDFYQEVYVNLLSRKGFTEYDSQKVFGGLKAFIFLVSKRYLIDLTRKKYSARNSKIKIISINTPVGDETILDSIEDEGAEILSMLFEVLESVSEERISSNYELSWKELLEMTLKFSPEEIAKEVKISVSRVKQLQRTLRREFVSVL